MRTVSSLALAGVVFAVCAHAQGVVGSGAVSGKIVDYTNSGIPDTTVIVANEKLGVRRTMDTTDEGNFNSVALPPAAGYTLKVTRKGFNDVNYPDFQVLDGHTLQFRIVMEQTAAAQRLKGEHASLDVIDTTFGAQSAFSEVAVDSLPVRDRDPSQLAPLALATTENYRTGVIAFRGESATNTYQTDGIQTQNTFFSLTPPVTPSESQEASVGVQIVSAGPSAEFEHSLGGWVNIASRAGGQGLHGELYDYFNPHSLNATDRFAPGFNPSGFQHQYGLNVGGPTGLSKMFWFVNLEQLDGHYAELNRATNGLLTNPQGTAINPANCTAIAPLCAPAISFLNSQLDREVKSSVASLGGLARADWRPNDFTDINIEADAVQRHSPDGANRQTVSNTNSLLGQNGTYTDESRWAKVGYTAVWSGNAVNEFRGGWYHDRLSDYADPTLLPSTGNLAFSIAGTSFGGNPNFPVVTSEGRYEINDNFSATLGSHFMKAGIDYSTTTDANNQIINRFGNYVYPTLSSFAQDFSGNAALHKDYSQFTQTFGRPVVNLGIRRFGIYVQDTWKIGKRVTVDFGVLWEKTFIPQPIDTNPTFFQTSQISSPAIDFAPRLGIAYQIDRKTVLRVGAGSFYAPFPGQLLSALYTGNAIYQLPDTYTSTQTGAPVFPKIPTSPGSVTGGLTDVTYAANKFRSPIVAQGSLSIERNVYKDLFVSLNYIYSRGIELWTAPEQNLNAPTITKTYTIDDAAGTPISGYTTSIYNAKTNGNFAHVYQVQNDGNSWYSGASVEVHKRFGYGIEGRVSYTWSHALDTVSGPAFIGGIVPAYVTPGQVRGDKGNSNYNQPNRTQVTWVWSPRFKSDTNWMDRYLINGWQLSGTGIFSSGLSQTPLVVVGGQQFTGVIASFPTTLNGSGGWSRVPFVPVNSLYEGAMYDVDARLTRDLPFTERIRARLMLEAFNALNTQWNTGVNTVAYIATGGVLHPVPGAGAPNAADGYPWGDNARHVQLALRITF